VSEENEGAHRANDLGSWLTSMGAPESIMELMPSEITGVDLAPLIAMLGGVGAPHLRTLLVDAYATRGQSRCCP